jgi:hypothetical protein
MIRSGGRMLEKPSIQKPIWFTVSERAMSGSDEFLDRCGFSHI